MRKRTKILLLDFYKLLLGLLSKIKEAAIILMALSHMRSIFGASSSRNYQFWFDLIAFR